MRRIGRRWVEASPIWFTGADHLGNFMVNFEDNLFGAVLTVCLFRFAAGHIGLTLFGVVLAATTLA